MGFSHQTKIYVHYLCKLLIYGHQICITAASDVSAFTRALTYFSRS